MDALPPMHLVAFGFRDVAAARAAEHELREHLDVVRDDISRHPAGGDARAGGIAFVLGGRFRAHRLELASAIVRRHGGIVLVNLPERAARLAPSAPGEGG